MSYRWTLVPCALLPHRLLSFEQFILFILGLLITLEKRCACLVDSDVFLPRKIRTLWKQPHLNTRRSSKKCRGSPAKRLN